VAEKGLSAGKLRSSFGGRINIAMLPTASRNCDDRAETFLVS